MFRSGLGERIRYLFDHLVSLALVQIDENKGLGKVFNSLFDPAGAEIYLKPVTNYVDTAQPLNFLL